MILDPIRIFLKVVETGSFSKTAQALNVAPSSITRSVDKLEAELRTQLLKRTTRQLSLTDNGHRFVAGAKTLVGDYEAITRSLSDKNEAPQGVLRISVLESFGRIHVCHWLPEFLQRYPDVKIELELENKVTDLTAENIDLAIRIGIPQDSSLKARRLLSNHTTILASPQYLAKSDRIDTPNDLTKHNCLLLNRNRQTTHWYFKRQRRKLKVRVQGNFKSVGGSPLIETAMAGLGVIQMANWATKQYVEAGKLEACLEEWSPALTEHSSGDIYVVYKQSHYPNQLIRLFIDFLVDKVGVMEL